MDSNLQRRVYSKKTPTYNPRNPTQNLSMDNNEQQSTTLSDNNAVSEDEYGRDAPVSSGIMNLQKTFIINLANSSKYEKREVKKKLCVELEKVRNFMKRIEGNEYGNGESLVGRSNDGVVGNGGVKRGFTEVDKGDKQGLRSPVGGKSGGGVLGKERAENVGSNKKVKTNGVVKGRGGGGRGGGGGGEREYGMENGSSHVFTNCKSLLMKLMKHKHGWVFNIPVDVKALGLQDYHLVIKHPMDLGTVKSRLDTKWYKSAREFAEDVRLTFSNAMTYNPKGQDVHVMAEQLLKIFEQGWSVIDSEYNIDSRFEVANGSSHPTPTAPMPKKVPRPLPVSTTEVRNADAVESERVLVDLNPRQLVSQAPSVGRTPVPKKPKAFDVEKRNMTYEEKQRLRQNLESLPSEKLENVVQIIKKRNASLFQQDDEIEVDIECFDIETLWELERFVLNYRKSLSKQKRKTEIAVARSEGTHTVQQRNLASVEVQTKTRETDKNVPCSPVQLEKQADIGGKSSSSSGSSSDSRSSSNDSDSGSSSASEAGS